MTIAEALHRGAARLSSLTARLDAEVLMRHVLGLSRVELYHRLFDTLAEPDAANYSRLIDRLAAGEPLQYLIGHIEFYGLDFYVNSSALIPRPETELLVEKTIALVRQIANRDPRPVTIGDIGCGSGAIAVTLAKHLPEATTLALDISPDALDLARRNAARHTVTNIEFIQSDLLEALAGRHLDIICANLPYVPTSEAESNRFEPQLALDGGTDGLDVIRRLVKQIAARDGKPEWVLLEFGTGQSAAVKTILDRELPCSQTEIIRDLIPLERVSVTRLSLLPFPA